MAHPIAPVPTFAGLVSEQAEHLYHRLRAARAMRVERFRAHGAPAAELVAAGLVYGVRERAIVVRPVEPATALRALLAEEHRRLATAHGRLLAGWAQLAALLPADEPGGGVRRLAPAPEQPAQPPLPEVTRRVLALMPTDDDAAIARKLRVSVSTVRRHIRSIYDALGVDSRFAAGVRAAKLGWL